MNRAADTYQMMMSIRDGLGDYVIWRENIESRKAINKEFDLLRSELSHVFFGDAC